MDGSSVSGCCWRVIYVEEDVWGCPYSIWCAWVCALLTLSFSFLCFTGSVLREMPLLSKEKRECLFLYWVFFVLNKERRARCWMKREEYFKTKKRNEQKEGKKRIEYVKGENEWRRKKRQRGLLLSSLAWAIFFFLKNYSPSWLGTAIALIDWIGWHVCTCTHSQMSRMWALPIDQRIKQTGADPFIHLDVEVNSYEHRQRSLGREREGLCEHGIVKSGQVNSPEVIIIIIIIN